MKLQRSLSPLRPADTAIGAPVPFRPGPSTFDVGGSIFKVRILMNLPLRPATAETNGSTMRGIDRAQGSLSTGDKDDNGLGNLGENHYASDNDVRIDVEEVPYAANPLWPDHPDIGLTAGGRLVQ